MENSKSEINKSQVIFGDIVYWLTITAAIICMIGPVLAFASMDGNVLNPHYLFAKMWSGTGPEAIWGVAGEVEKGGHWWVNSLGTGDGFTQLGLVIGCSVALPAMLAAAMVYAFKERSLGWALGALWIVGLVAISVLGIVRM